MKPKPDFEALRAERNRRVTESLQRLADEECEPCDIQMCGYRREDAVERWNTHKEEK